MGGETFPGAAGILLEGHVEKPVQLVLDGPVPAGQHVEVGGLGEGFVADVAADEGGGTVAVIHRRGDLHQGFQAGPPSAHRPVLDGGGVQDAAVTGLDAPVARVHLGGRVQGPVVPEGRHDLLVQGVLVFLDGQEIVGLLLPYALGDAHLGADGVHRDHRPLQVEFFQEPGDGRYLVLLALQPQLSQGDVVFAHEGVHQVVPFGPGGPGGGAAQLLAVDGHLLFGQRFQELAAVVDQATLDFPGVNRAHQPLEGVGDGERSV